MEKGRGRKKEKENETPSQLAQGFFSHVRPMVSAHRTIKRGDWGFGAEKYLGFQSQ